MQLLEFTNELQKGLRKGKTEVEAFQKIKEKTSVEGVSVTVIGYNVTLGKIIAQSSSGQIISAENLGRTQVYPGTKGMYQPNTKTIDFTTY